jgi:hypothetical protein
MLHDLAFHGLEEAVETRRDGEREREREREGTVVIART